MFFRTHAPCEAFFAEALAFMHATRNMAHRGVCKRWILCHLREQEYNMQPIEWEKFPRCSAYYQKEGLEIFADPATTNPQSESMILFHEADKRRASDSTDDSGFSVL